MRQVWFKMRRVLFRSRARNIDYAAGLEQEGSDSAPKFEALDSGVCFDSPGPFHVPCPELTPTFPAQMDTLSIDAGFDQSPVLQSL